MIKLALWWISAKRWRLW